MIYFPLKSREENFSDVYDLFLEKKLICDAFHSQEKIPLKIFGR